MVRFEYEPVVDGGAGGLTPVFAECLRKLSRTAAAGSWVRGLEYFA